MRFAFVPSLALAVLVAGAAPAAAAPLAPSGLTGIDAMTGTVFQQGQSSFSGIAVRLRCRSSALVPNVEILPTVEYWQNNSHIDDLDVKTMRRDATLGVDGRWVFDRKGGRPYVGAGFSVHFLDSEVRAPRLNVPRATSAVTKGAVDVLGGMDFDIGGRLGSFIEGKFLNVTQYRQFKLNTGLHFSF